jgi:hypothetical protein
MKYDRNQAKALTNARELELYDMARPPKLNRHSVKELRDLVRRSRTLRDKLRDVKLTQVRSKLAKTKTRGVEPAERSRAKAELFSEVHEALVARLEKVEAGDAKARAKPATKKPTKTDKNIKTRAERTSVKQKLKKVKKIANAPAPGPAGKKRSAKAKKEVAESDKSSSDKPKKLLASAAVSKTGSRSNAGGRSEKATFASKSAQNPEVDAQQSSQSSARRESSVGKVEQSRIARSGITRQRGHLSGLNKRRQGKRDSK